MLCTKSYLVMFNKSLKACIAPVPRFKFLPIASFGFFSVSLILLLRAYCTLLLLFSICKFDAQQKLSALVLHNSFCS
jgi:hypothetical protein